MLTTKTFNKRYENLKSERSSFIPVYQELSDYHLHYRGRFLASDRNKGYTRNDKQINNHSRLASRTLSSGMMAGIASPARPWFRLSAPTKQLNEVQAVKKWLFDAQSMMFRVFASSNFYDSIHALFSELGVFGTASMGIYPDFDNVIHCKTFTVGSYCIGTNEKNQVDTFYREYEITVDRCVKQFGIEKCSDHVKNLWKQGSTETWVKIIHAIEPNDDRDMINPMAKHKRYRSVYYEVNKQNKNENQFLKESGFDVFPNVSPRWDVTGEDIYATNCPGMDALSDTKSLQLGEKRMYQALDKISQNKLQGPSKIINEIKAKGGLNRVDMIANDDANNRLMPVYNLNPSFDHLLNVNNRTEQRISRAMYEDLFLMLANSDRRQITAREIAEKHEEKLLMLGPVLERVHNELLDPIIDITFHRLQEAGVLPPPPEELADTEIKVDYTSVLAQAQKLIGVGAIERTVGFAAEIANVWPDARHKVDHMQIIDDYADANGINPALIRSDDDVAEIIRQEKEAIAAQEQMAQVAAGAEAAKTISETNISQDNALGTVLQNSGLV